MFQLKLSLSSKKINISERDNAEHGKAAVDMLILGKFFPITTLKS